jgi:hypothetical protein
MTLEQQGGGARRSVAIPELLITAPTSNGSTEPTSSAHTSKLPLRAVLPLSLDQRDHGRKMLPVGVQCPHTEVCDRVHHHRIAALRPTSTRTGGCGNKYVILLPLGADALGGGE